MGRTAVETRLARGTAMEKRQQALRSMTPALQEKTRLIESKFGTQSDSTLRFYHWLGEQCHEIREDRKTFGANAFSLLQDVMSVRKETLRKAALFYQLYPLKRDLDRLLDLHNPEDESFRVTWSHVIYLINVSQRPLRLEFEQRIATEMLEPDELHAAIMQKYGGRRSTGGRPLAIPRTLPAQVRQIHSVSRTWLNRYATVWNGDKHSVFGNVLNTPPDKITPEMLAELQAIRDVMAEMTEALNTGVAATSRVIEHVAAVVSRRGAGAAATQPPATAGKGAAKTKPPAATSKKKPPRNISASRAKAALQHARAG